MLIVESLEEMRAAVEQFLVVVLEIGRAQMLELRRHLLLSLALAHGMPVVEVAAVDAIMIPVLKLINTGKAVPVALEVAELEVVGP